MGLPELSNYGCLPGRAGGSPFCTSSLSDSAPDGHDLILQRATGLSGHHAEDVIVPGQPRQPSSRLYPAL